MADRKFTLTISKQVRACTEKNAPGLQIARIFPLRMYEWLQTEHTSAKEQEAAMEALVRMYPKPLWSCLNWQTQKMFDSSVLMSGRVYFAMKGVLGMDIAFVNKEESKGFSFLIRLDGRVALVADRNI